MSGGSYDYAFRHVEDFADELRKDGGCGDYSDATLRELFRAHLRKVARAMRAIEWNDSGDGDRDEQALIRACIAPEPLPDALREAFLVDLEAVCGAIETARWLLGASKEGT